MSGCDGSGALEIAALQGMELAIVLGACWQRCMTLLPQGPGREMLHPYSLCQALSWSPWQQLWQILNIAGDKGTNLDLSTSPGLPGAIVVVLVREPQRV